MTYKQKGNKMKSLLEQVSELDELIRQVEKIRSKIWAGQIVQAWRDIGRIEGCLKKNRSDLIADSERKDD